MDEFKMSYNIWSPIQILTLVSSCYQKAQIIVSEYSLNRY